MADISQRSRKHRLLFAAGCAVTAMAAVVMLWVVPDNRSVQAVAMGVWIFGLGWIIRNAR